MLYQAVLAGFYVNLIHARVWKEENLAEKMSPQDWLVGKPKGEPSLLWVLPPEKVATGTIQSRLSKP